MTDDDLEALVASHHWQRPAARELALWLVALAAPVAFIARPVWAMRVVRAALTGQRRVTDGHR